MKTCVSNKLYCLALEKLVIGVEEPILIKGIGELIAKIDSGNSGYNVIHGEDITIQGNIINFKTFNKDGDERRVSKKIKDLIKINIGGGHIQERPVVELDVLFAGETYKKIPFSITNRSDNLHKILISKDFVGNELNALIDVTKNNISDDSINVDYISEGILKTLAKPVTGTASLIDKLPNFVSPGDKYKEKVQKSEQFLNSMLGKGTSRDMSESADKVETDIKAINEIKNWMGSDLELIKREIENQKKKFPENFDADISSKMVESVKLLDYVGNTPFDNINPDFKTKLQEAIKVYTSSEDNENDSAGNTNNLQNNQTKTENNKNVNTAAPVTSAAQNNQINQNTQTAQNNQTDTAETSKQSLNKKEAEKIINEIKNRNKAIFYIVNFKNNKNGKQLPPASKIIDKNSLGIIKSYGRQLSDLKTKWDFSNFTPLAKKLSETVNSAGRGLFALCTGEQNSRKVNLFINPGLFGASSDSATNDNDIDEFVEEYNRLNSEYLKIAESMGQSVNNINEQDLLALIEIAQQSVENKEPEELDQTAQDDSVDPADVGSTT